LRHQPIDVLTHLRFELSQAFTLLKAARHELVAQPFGLRGVAAIERFE
jgi:hypothetical protein